MTEFYEAVIELVETRDVTMESDRVLQGLGEEIARGSLPGPALLEALSFLDRGRDHGRDGARKKPCAGERRGGTDHEDRIAGGLWC